MAYNIIDQTDLRHLNWEVFVHSSYLSLHLAAPSNCALVTYTKVVEDSEVNAMVLPGESQPFFFFGFLYPPTLTVNLSCSMYLSQEGK